MLLPECLPVLYSVLKLFPYTELSHRAIICNTIRFYLMYKSWYYLFIYLQILTVKATWFSVQIEYKYFQISVNNQIFVFNDLCLRWVQWLFLFQLHTEGVSLYRGKLYRVYVWCLYLMYEIAYKETLELTYKVVQNVIEICQIW